MTTFGARLIRSDLQEYSPPRMVGETVTLGGTTPRNLLHSPIDIVAAYSFDEVGARIDYTEGVDYVATETGIRRATGSSIYDFSSYTINMNGPGGTTFIRADDPRNPPLVLHKQLYVDYTADFQPQTITGLAEAPFTGNILCCGDSITAGAHTITGYYRASDRDSYVGRLRDYFRNAVDVRNYSTSGSSAEMLVDDIDAILAASTKPSAMVVAYGMNDHTFGLGAPLTTFEAQINEIVDKCLIASVVPVLVGFFKKNDQWVDLNVPAIEAYNAALESIAAANSIGFVDIKTAFEEFGTVKDRILELTGDNFHHPNNFGQRIYFSQILPHLLASDVSSADVADFVATPA